MNKAARYIFGRSFFQGKGSVHLQNFCTYIGEYAGYIAVGHCIALVEVSHGCAQFAVRSAKLGDNDLRQFGIGIRDFYGVLQFLFIDPHNSFLSFQQFSQGQGCSAHFQLSPHSFP